MGGEGIGKVKGFLCRKHFFFKHKLTILAILFLLKGDRTSINDFRTNPYHRPYCAGPMKGKLCVGYTTHSHPPITHAHFLSRVSMADLSLGHRQESYCGLAFTNLFAFP